MAVPKSKKIVLWFNELAIEDVPFVGGKNASLGEMYRALSKKKVLVPNGFAVTAHAYRAFLEEAGIADKIKKALRKSRVRRPRAARARRLHLK